MIHLFPPWPIIFVHMWDKYWMAREVAVTRMISMPRDDTVGSGGPLWMSSVSGIVQVRKNVIIQV